MRVWIMYINSEEIHVFKDINILMRVLMLSFNGYKFEINDNTPALSNAKDLQDVRGYLEENFYCAFTKEGSGKKHYIQLKTIIGDI